MGLFSELYTSKNSILELAGMTVNANEHTIIDEVSIKKKP